jgi:hypothetical protein
MRYCYFSFKSICMDYHRLRQKGIKTVCIEDIELADEEPRDKSNEEKLTKELATLHWYDVTLFKLHVVEKMSFRQIEKQVKISSRSAWETCRNVKEVLKLKLSE